MQPRRFRLGVRHCERLCTVNHNMKEVCLCGDLVVAELNHKKKKDKRDEEKKEDNVFLEFEDLELDNKNEQQKLQLFFDLFC